MSCIATKEERRTWCPGKCKGCVHDVDFVKTDYSINVHTALMRAFPEASWEEINAFRTSDLEHTPFMLDIERYLEDQGYEFGCGRKNGCPPGMHLLAIK